LIGGAEGELSRRRWLANALLALGVLACAALYVWPPGRTGFYPACPIHEYLHIDCPGCGATRALAALLHGRLGEAMRLNALFVLMLPFGLAGGTECYRRAVRAGEFRWPVAPGAAVYAGLAVAAVFIVVRNVFGWGA
jgi:Protein of unknown function (DUF2752)